MANLSILSTLLCLLRLSLAFDAYRKAATFLASIPTTLLPPSQDPFYTAPAGFESAAPGAVLRVRAAPGNLTQVIPNCAAAYNIVYRTTDSTYNASWAVTTLYIPQAVSSNATNSTSSSLAPNSALLSYQVPYDSADVDYSPSYTFYAGGADPNVAYALSQGWYLNVPDYEGPLASFTAGVQSGHATLDSVRAVLNSGFGLANDAKYAMLGYSGGALASEWAAELQVQYAPELNFAGVALGGLTPNVTSVIETINETPFAELTVNGIIGLATQHPAANQYLSSQLKTSGPYNATGFLAARNQSTTADAVEYANQNIYDYFQSGQSVLLSNPIVQAAVNSDGIMGYHGVPQMPVFAYKAIGDEISKVADTDALIDRFCGVGANILYQRNTVGGHVSEAYNGGPASLTFLGAVFDGSYASKYQANGCTIQTVTISFDSSPL